MAIIQPDDVPTLICFASLLLDPADPESLTSPCCVDLQTGRQLQAQGYQVLICPTSEAVFDEWLQMQQWMRRWIG